jgi:hypothetical protein
MSNGIRYSGPLVSLANSAAGLKGSIHDDERARELGFRRGFVPGTTLSLLVQDALAEVYGDAWFHGGWHDLKFIDAAYDDEPVRVELTGDRLECLDVQVRSEAGRLTCGGSAGLGTTPPWHAEVAGARAGRAFPSSVIGTAVPAFEFTPRREHFAGSLCEGIRARWFTGSPVPAAPYAPSCALLPVSRQAQNAFANDGARMPGMNARMQMLYLRPVRLGQSYVAQAHLADKGESGRTWFRTIGFSLDDAAGRVLLARHTIKWWAAAEPAATAAAEPAATAAAEPAATAAAEPAATATAEPAATAAAEPAATAAAEPAATAAAEPAATAAAGPAATAAAGPAAAPQDTVTGHR